MQYMKQIYNNVIINMYLVEINVQNVKDEFIRLQVYSNQCKPNEYTLVTQT